MVHTPLVGGAKKLNEPPLYIGTQNIAIAHIIVVFRLLDFYANVEFVTVSCPVANVKMWYVIVLG